MIRPLESTDYPRIQELFAMQAFDYELPDIRMLSAAQVYEVDGQIEQAVLARPTVELYFLCNPDWATPLKRFQALQKIHETMRWDLQAKGFDDVHVFLPPEKALSFGRRLMRDFGWTRPLWTPFTRLTAPQNRG